MKLPKPFTIYDLRFTGDKPGRVVNSLNGCAHAATGLADSNRQSSIVNRKSRSGIALIITLILLSVTLVMAVAFLAISNRERGSVTTSTDMVTAKLAADSALAAAQAQIIATLTSTTNPFSAGLIVSTNFQNSFGFVAGVSDPTNVNYDYLSTGGILNTVDERNQNIANLLYLPRPPVYVVNPQTGSSDFRFYLDLNRNGLFEPNGFVDETNNAGFWTGATPYETGDPQWVGVLERPDVPHGPNNKFVSRYAFFAVPADSLDLNAIHNQALHGSVSALVDPPPIGDTFFRNQGVGSWEINLAAFLADLNTNQWDAQGFGNEYNYLEPVGNYNKGAAFDDARALLAYRYAYNYLSLARASDIFPATALPGPVDLFPLGSLTTNTATPFYNWSLNNSWAGADNTNHYFALASDLFAPGKTALGVSAAQQTLGNYFTGRLLNAGTNAYGGNSVSTYDRYTFYRMLAQMGTDSTPETDKINLNYSNAAAFYDGKGILTSTVVYPNAETNLVPWQPLQFFNIAADRMLRDYTASWFRASPSNYLATFYNIHTNYYFTDGNGNLHVNDPNGLGLTGLFGVPNVLGLTSDRVPSFGITNIPVQVNGEFVYSPAVQRILQMAANIYDATTNRAAPGPNGKDYPSVFRPVFEHNNFGGVYITGFTTVGSGAGINTVTGAGDPQLALPFDVTNLFALPANQPIMSGGYFVNVYGVPWIIGAKKGFPNFNEFSMESVVQVTRKLQVTRTTPGGVITPGVTPTITGTNQMYIFSITNYLGVEFWNSYTNGYSNTVQVVVRDNFSAELTNQNNYPGAHRQASYLVTAITNVVNWPGWINNNKTSFVLPFGTSGTEVNLLTNSVYRFNPPDFVDSTLNPGYENYPPTMLPQFGLQLTNRLQVFMLDGNHVIDYASFNGPDRHRNLNAELADPDANGGLPFFVWSTNLIGTVPFGVPNQISISMGSAIPSQDGNNWEYPSGLPAALRSGKELAMQAYFRGFFAPNSTYSFGSGIYTNQELMVQVPYTPTRYLVDYVSWQANDPLVHYLGSDMYFSGAEPSSKLVTGQSKWNTSPDILSDLRFVNQTYQPWGAKVLVYAGADTNAYNLALKDPLIWNSDDWNFPSFKLPTAGWLGRVHRGTPWQTAYLKADNILKEPKPGDPTSNIGIATWANWTGGADRFTLTNTAPVQDRKLFDIFTTALNDNATRGQLSVNQGSHDQPSLAAWSALFSGMQVLTNTTQNPAASIIPTYEAITINPAGSAGLNSPLGALAVGINNMRAKFVNPDGVVGAFEHVGDILSTPQLTEQSPFLNWNNLSQQKYGISDQMYEWLPQQAMSLLRVDSAPRYVIYSYGQTLKPAPDGVVTSGPNLANGTSPFGMVTNYQIVAESATRAVVQVIPVVTMKSDGTLSTNYNTRVEQFNVLPPD